MGCNQSTEDRRLQTVDDSVHVMLAHDKKVQQRKGEEPHGYVPRAEHPLLKKIQCNEDEGDGTQPSPPLPSSSPPPPETSATANTTITTTPNNPTSTPTEYSTNHGQPQNQHQ